MGLVSDLKGPLVGFVLSVVVFVVVGLFGLFEVLSTLTEPGATLVTALLAAMPYVVGLVLVGFAGLGFLAWGLYRAAVGAVEGDNRLLRNRYLATLARFLERESATARDLNLSEYVEPSAEEKTRRRVQQLKDDYAAGELSDAEFERRLERVLADTQLDESDVYGDETIDSYERDQRTYERE